MCRGCIDNVVRMDLTGAAEDRDSRRMGAKVWFPSICRNERGKMNALRTTGLLTILTMLPIFAGPSEQSVTGKPAIYPEARDSFSDQMAKEILKQKACSGVTVTASKQAADYTAHTGRWTWSYTVSRHDGRVIATGKVQRMSTMAKEICQAIDKDRTDAHDLQKK